MTIDANIEAIPAFVEPPVRAPVLTFLGEIGMTGNLSLVTPCPIHWLPAVIIGMIDYADDLQRRGQTDLAVFEVRRIEKVLKITDADRLAATRATEAWELGFLEIMADMAPAPSKAVALALPADAGRFTPNEERDLDTALAKLRRAKNAGSRESAAEEIKKIRQRPRQRLENAWRAAAMDETAALAQARGEEVEVGKSGSVQVITRDGLQRLLNIGRITEEQYRAGLTYREGYESRSGDLQAVQVGEGGSGHDNNHFVAQRFERALASNLVAKIDRAVALGCISDPAALQMLRWVAGQSRNLTDWGKGRALERNRRALGVALDVAARTITEEQRRKPGLGV